MEPKKWMFEKEKLLRKKKLGPIIEDAFYQERMMILKLDNREIFDYMMSKINYSSRKEQFSKNKKELEYALGDICYIDFGPAYQHEIGYLHFGVIIAKSRGKIFVVPMTGNDKAYDSAYDKNKNSRGKKHLMRLGEIPGLNKASTLFLNDAKWINPSRIIEIKAHLDIQSELFIEMKRRMIEIIVKQ